MGFYPVFLDLSNHDTLVVGAGEVGRRKIAALAAARPRTLMVVDPANPHPDMLPLLPEIWFRYEQRSFLPKDIDGKFLVIAATSSSKHNAEVAEVCKAQRVLCNVIDSPRQSDFYVPATIRSGDITLAVGTGGTSPALARRIRTDLEAWLGNRYTALAIVMGRLRPLTLALGLPDRQNADIFRSLVNSSLADHLCTGDGEAARNILEQLLPPTLRHVTGELLHDL
jgi:precorrin-2 dehydrogenase/sirohydrochlorin ferrochelatase